MDFENVKTTLRRIALEYVSKGPGYAQEGVVLREACNVLGSPENLEQEQLILDAWHSLFRDSEFDWGHNIANPGAPFFHQVVRRKTSAE